ncbi:MAG: lipocalin family protein [Hydrogeniiclostridium mannosilyticum]
MAGTWEITAGKEDGASLTREETIEALGADMRLEIRADGTFTAVAMADGKETNSTEGEWSQEGNSFILLANGEAETFELSGSTLIAEDGGVTLIFEKK